MPTNRQAILTEIQKLAAALAAKDFYAGVIAELAAALETGILQSIEGAINPVATAKARALAQTAARSLTEQLTKSQLSSMGDTIARALENGMRPLDIASQLQEVQALDSVRAQRYLKMQEYLEQSGLGDKDIEDILERQYQKMLSDRRKTIAQTEGRIATSTARRDEAEKNGDKWKRASTRADERVCPVCRGNQAAGVIPIDKPFPSGHMLTPFHPGNCGCTISYVPDGAAKRNAEINAAEETARLEAEQAKTPEQLQADRERRREAYEEIKRKNRESIKNTGKPYQMTAEEAMEIGSAKDR